MFSPKFILFCVAGMLCIFVCAGDSKMKSCVETEKQALLKLKHGFINDGHILSSWNGEVDCCQWYGISCNNMTGHVTKLSVSGENYPVELRGNINPSLCELQYLTHLYLSFRDFEGSEIPKCIGSLTQLRELILSSSGFVGTIPHELGNLSNLQTLDLSWNYDLVPKSLEWVSHLSSLRYLDLSGVNLSGAIDWKSSLLIKAPPQLKKLVLSGASLVGIIPHELGNLSNLQTLDLRGNDNLIANDLEWVSHLSSLRYLGLSMVNLSGAMDWQSSLSSILPSLLELHLDYCSLPHVNPKSHFHMNSSTSLQVLSLASNELDSSILSWVSNSCQLNTLHLSANKMSFTLSDWIHQLECAQSSIETLDLSDNPFDSGPFPDLSRFTSLVSLNLRNTNLSGSIPQSFGYLPHLLDLDLSYNNWSGELIPQTFEQLPNLTRLMLSSNKLEGVINEAHLLILSSLELLDISDNSISFGFSSNWVPSFELYYLLASECNIGPDIPAWLKYQTKLEILDLSNGRISNSFPIWFWNLSPTLGYLNVSHNKICGALPKSLPKFNVSSFPSFYIWDLSFNNLSGPLPHFSPNASVLILSNNKFSGSISSLCATSQTDLNILDLSNNRLSGSLPDCWWQFPNLEVLNLANNDFSSTIPNSFITLTMLETIHLNGNNLSGQIPSLRNALNLQLVDFGQNSFNGSIPTWIGDYLPNLVVLRLEANRFGGSIPTSLCNLSSLQILDLSHNNLIGQIPHCLDNLSAMSNITLARKIMSYQSAESFGFYEVTITPSFMDTAVLTWKGEYVEYSKNLGLMTSIDLSCNHLIGEIPSSITTLVALASLNLSRNDLTGFIPNNMGDMKMLESLDLSSNTIFGEVPESFSSLNFLSYLDLSFNNLSGKIPESTQLQSFNASSYKGNEGLCGLPLSKYCPRGESNSDHTHTTNANDEDDKLITFGFYISLILGFIIGFWGVCGTLILKSSWRHAYFQFFINIYDWIYVQLVVSMERIKRRLQA